MASVKLLQFRLDLDKNYDDRYGSLIKVADRYLPRRWSQATSSFLFHHPAATFELMDRFKSESSIHLDGRDMLLIMDLTTLAFDQIGVDDPNTLRGILATQWAWPPAGIDPVPRTFGSLAVGLGIGR